MKYFIIPLLLFSFQVDAAARRLSECVSFPETPTEAAPFDLDLCPLNDGDDVTQLLTDIQARWPGGFYVRAPSKSLSVVSDTIFWPSETKRYVFLEDQDPSNTLLIQHATSPRDFWVMWSFQNFSSVRIGGQNLSITFKGNHPGLANCTSWPNWFPGFNCSANKGLVEFRMSDGTNATLAEFKANIRYSQTFALYTWGNLLGSTNRIEHFKVAGTFYATSGIFFHQGVKNAWADPDRTYITDPYIRASGFTGIASTTAPPQEGYIAHGCIDLDREQKRTSTFMGYGFDTLTGGFTLEHASLGFVPRNAGYIGTADQPFIIRLKDMGITGPGTPYQAGLRTKSGGETLFFKGDPAGPLATSPSRYIRVILLEPTYGHGATSLGSSNCIPANMWDGGYAELFRLENNVGDATTGYHFEFAGDWRTYREGGKFTRGPLITFGGTSDTAPNYGHTARLASGTVIGESITLRDRTTVTGSGTWTDLTVADASDAVQGKDSTIADTNVAGAITISANTERTTIRNVNFLGPARTIISIGSAADASVSRICAASGSSITGSGTLVYEGVVRALPFVIVSANGCSVGSTAVPNPPNEVRVD